MIKGIAGLRAAINLVETMGTKRDKHNLNSKLRGQCVKLIDEGFKMQRDPYGKPWAPRKDKSVRGKILVRTSAMRRSWKHGHVVTTTNFTLKNDMPYTWYHQHGSQSRTFLRPRNKKAMSWGNGKFFSTGHKRGKIPARKMIPDGRMPNRWAARFNAKTVEHYRSIIARKVRK